MVNPGLAEKIAIWRHAWESDDQNSIKKQILILVWDAGIFGCINECRRPDESGVSPDLNGPVQDFIDRNFVASQMARMRRLVDGYPLHSPNNESKDNSVFSLRSLVSDIRKNRHLMTREAIFNQQQIEYDLSVAEAREWEEISKEIESGASTMWVSSSAWPTRDLHQLWDRLSGVSVAARSEKDVPSTQVFDRMIADLKRVDQAKDWATVFVAHAASTSSREASGKGDIPTWGDIEEMTATIVRVASAVSELIFQAHMAGWLATPQYDLFKNWNRPWCDEKRRSELRGWWTSFEKRVESWPNTEKYVEGLTCS